VILLNSRYLSNEFTYGTTDPTGWNDPLLSPKKYRLEMPLEQVRSHIPRYDFFVCFQRLQVPIAHLCSYLESDMQQLTKTRIISLIALLMPQRRGVLCAGPAIHLFRLRQFAWVDVDHRRVRRAQFLAMGVGLGVDLFRYLQSRSPGLGQADQFLQPSRPRRLHMNAGVERLHRVV